MPDSHAEEAHGHEPLGPLDLARIGFAGLAIVATWLRLWEPFPRFDAAGFAAVLIGGYPIFREALADLWSRRMTMELSMTIALAAGPGHRRGLHRAGHRLLRLDRRGA